MKLKRIIANCAVFGVSAGLAALLCELAARVFLNPADYLSVEMKEDPVLGAVPSLNSQGSGLDRWGFRNRGVPATVDIVALGDSHTYGNTATMEDSWPYVLGRLTGRTVYNMGQGGYGPNQYYHLLKSKALGLKPRTVVCGLYMGDDFENAFLITYGLSHWAHLRRLSSGQVQYDIWGTAPRLSWQKRIRVWLSRHSVAYQLVFHGPLMGHLQGEFQIRNAARLYDSATSLNIPGSNILEAFRPKSMLLRIDQENPAVREGMRITFCLLKDMDEMCRRSGVRFLVAVIPTKETVFSDEFARDATVPQREVVSRLVANERLARERTFRFLEESGISYVDTLPALKASRGQALYARTAADMHPSKNGYRVIAEAVHGALN